MDGARLEFTWRMVSSSFQYPNRYPYPFTYPYPYPLHYLYSIDRMPFQLVNYSIHYISSSNKSRQVK